MRHASSPDKPPTAKQADRENTKRERQLDATGRAAARDMGAAIRRLRIPIGEVLSSPTYRAQKTVRLASFGTPKVFTELGDAGRSMERAAVASWSDWLRKQVATMPLKGTDRVIVTQMPNIADAFGPEASGLKSGGALIFQPDGKGGAELVARVPIEQWPDLARQAP
jgi:hypothetical protein